MENQDVRWKQRFANFEKALKQLAKFIEKEELKELEEQGLIQCFEYTHELAWNVMKDFLTFEGIQNIIGSRSATREAFNKGLVEEQSCAVCREGRRRTFPLAVHKNRYESLRYNGYRKHKFTLPLSRDIPLMKVGNNGIACVKKIRYLFDIINVICDT